MSEVNPVYIIRDLYTQLQDPQIKPKKKAEFTALLFELIAETSSPYRQLHPLNPQRIKLFREFDGIEEHTQHRLVHHLTGREEVRRQLSRELPLCLPPLVDGASCLMLHDGIATRVKWEHVQPPNEVDTLSQRHLEGNLDILRYDPPRQVCERSSPLWGVGLEPALHDIRDVLVG